jgi:protein-tyrosine phosphatase
VTNLPLEGAQNARDVGGYPTASGGVTAPLRLLRTARLDLLTDADRRYLASIGLRTLVDLRTQLEIEQAPDALGTLDVEVFHTPPRVNQPGDDDLAMEELYRAWTDHSGDRFTEAFRALARPGGLPGLVHCTAGKDRTGILVALILSLAGVDDKVIVEDYLVSNTALRFDTPAPLANHRILPGHMTGLLAHVRERYGDAEGYFKAFGATDEEIARIRKALVEG